jgi:hypothetical protein
MTKLEHIIERNVHGEHALSAAAVTTTILAMLILRWCTT